MGSAGLAASVGELVVAFWNGGGDAARTQTGPARTGGVYPVAQDSIRPNPALLPDGASMRWHRATQSSWLCRWCCRRWPPSNARPFPLPTRRKFVVKRPQDQPNPSSSGSKSPGFFLFDEALWCDARAAPCP